MTNRQKFSQCLEAGRRIVEAYRAGAPDGCDPQNSGIIAANAVIALGTAAYGAYNQNQANKKLDKAARDAAKNFKPIDPAAVGRQAVAADVAGYELSDKDWEERFKHLKLGRDFEIADMQGDLMGDRINPAVSSALESAGLGGSIPKGNAYRQARDLGLPVTAMRDRSRTHFASLLSTNPERTFGLSGQDVANISMANTNSSDLNLGALTGSRINAYNAAIAQQGQTNQLVLGTLATALSNYGRPQQQNPGVQAGMFGSGNLSDRPIGA